LSDKEFSLYEEEEEIIVNANKFINNTKDLNLFKAEFLTLFENYKKLFRQSKRLIRMSDKMEAELATTKAELEKYSNKLKIQASTDTLTGIPNRRKIMDLLVHALEKSIIDKEYNFNIIMMDIDFFKKVNDNYGHPMGDTVIKVISKHFFDKLKNLGVIGRYGGEEFLSIFYNKNINETYDFADKLRKEIKDKIITNDGVSLSVTVSMGIASSKESNDLNQILDIADRRLYKAKENGRNKVFFS
tara:strand:+ start:1427 stop:2158 length:732 start_codon:yes stop_codon:yes gene_type:complete